MEEVLLRRVDEIQAISAVRKILETVAAMTGLRFVCFYFGTLCGLDPAGHRPAGAIEVSSTGGTTVFLFRLVPSRVAVDQDRPGWKSVSIFLTFPERKYPPN